MIHIIKKNGKFYKLLIGIFLIVIFNLCFVSAGTVKIIPPTAPINYSISVNVSGLTEIDPICMPYITNGTFAYNSSLENYYLASNPNAYISDGNTFWDNIYGFCTNDALAGNLTDYMFISSWNTNLTNINNNINLNNTDAKLYANTIVQSNITGSFNETYANYVIANISNSTTWWAGLTGWLSGWLVNNDGILEFNGTKFNEEIDSKLLGEHWFFVEEELVYGTSDGTLSLTQQFDDYDAISYNLTETTPQGLEYYANTSNDITTDINRLCLRYKAEGDNFAVSLWSISLNNWEGYTTLISDTIFNWDCKEIRDSADHLVDGKIMMRIIDTGSASIQHKLYIDAMYVSSGYTPRIGNIIETDPNFDENLNESLNQTQFIYDYPDEKLNIKESWLTSFINSLVSFTDTWSTNHTFYYTKIETDNNFSKYVPYEGANQDLDLGLYNLFAYSIIGTNTNWDIAYNHTKNNTQAHTDYLLNNADDTSTGGLTATSFTTVGPISGATGTFTGTIATGGGASVLNLNGGLITDTSGTISFDNENLTTSSYGFFGWLGTLTNRITKAWFTNIDLSGTIQMNQGNITNATYIIMNEKSGACDLTINHSICANSTGMWIIG